MRNRKGRTFKERFRDILSDPNNKHIPRVSNAGKTVDNCLIMHNGIKIMCGSYYGPFCEIFKLNKGVHEPQEERVFMEVLKDIPKQGTIIELGAYWCFYSMWFSKEVTKANCYLVEPDPERLDIGKRHFSVNGLQGDFTQAVVGNKLRYVLRSLASIRKDTRINNIIKALSSIKAKTTKIDIFLKEKNIDFVDVLHCDIQGEEIEMLKGAEKSMAEGRIKYIFISTHSQRLHYRCLSFLKKYGYEIIASADHKRESFCFDGVLVGRLAKLNGINHIDLGNRSKTKLIPQKEFEIFYANNRRDEEMSKDKIAK